jgi:hypothetical protein
MRVEGLMRKMPARGQSSGFQGEAFSINLPNASLVADRV